MLPSLTIISPSGMGGPPFPSTNWPFAISVIPVAVFVLTVSSFDRAEEGEDQPHHGLGRGGVDVVTDPRQLDVDTMGDQGGHLGRMRIGEEAAEEAVGV